MTIYYHFASRSFLNTATHSTKSIPSDAVEITPAIHKSLLAGESNGKTIGMDEHGQPVLIDPVDDPNAVANQERYWRDAEIEKVKWLRERHRDEVELSLQVSLNADQWGELLTYLQLLRDWPQSAEFPDSTHRPPKPVWIDQQPR
ncbi:phage tail assembly chaperone [Pseudomonas sp. PAB10]|uniref:phage tail assembly chaperone n=1 Tax=Pseudomonas sp. PAB10 TaxID=3233047 RepID=UPI003F97CC7A